MTKIHVILCYQHALKALISPPLALPKRPSSRTSISISPSHVHGWVTCASNKVTGRSRQPKRMEADKGQSQKIFFKSKEKK